MRSLFPQSSRRHVPLPGLTAATAAAALLTLVPGAQRTAQAQVLANPGFETPVQGFGNFTYNTTGAGWTFTGGSGISGNGSGFTGGNPANAPEGVQVGFLQLRDSIISQSVSGFSAGTYNISFLAAQRGSGGATQPSTQDFTVAFDSVTVGTFQPSAITYDPFTTSSVFLTADVHTITFRGLNTANAVDVTAFIDNVRINRVAAAAPEPGTFALLAIAGTPLVGMVLRRRKA